MLPLWVQLWSFHSSRFYCLTCGNLEKKKEEKKREEEEIKRERKEEGIKKERRKDRKKELKEKKYIYYLNKKMPPAGFKLAKPVLLVFLAAAGSGRLV